MINIDLHLYIIEDNINDCILISNSTKSIITNTINKGQDATHNSSIRMINNKIKVDWTYLLIALFGYLSNYNGTFPFNTPGDSYEGYDEIMYMRLGCALLGAGMVPLSFLTVWELTRSLLASSFSEIGLLTLSKFILLDPILMFYMMASFHGLCMFNRENITI
ncbi:Protein O-mannosyl-transferase 2, partial [Armadillidium nasatum]